MLSLLVIGILFVSILSPIFHPILLAVAQDPAVSLLASPVSLKQDAIVQLGIANGSGSDKVIFDQAKSGLKNSVAIDFWDDFHLKNPLALAGDVLIVKSLQSSTAYKNGSCPGHQAVVTSILDIVQSDRGLDGISINDTVNASKRVKRSVNAQIN